MSVRVGEEGPGAHAHLRYCHRGDDSGVFPGVFRLLRMLV
jgi:hypothetical protein